MSNVIINEKDNVGVCLNGDEKIPAGEKGVIDATEGGEVVYKRQ